MFRKTTFKTACALATASLIFSGCASNIDNAKGKPTVYEDVSTTGSVGGVGIESQDVVAVTDKMMRDMMANPLLTGRSTPPRIIIDNEYIKNESTSVVNTNMLTDRLRIELNRAANGRMVFVGRHFSDMVQKERDLKRDGAVDGGTIRKTAAQAGADFRLGGRISSLDAIDRNTGTQSRYSQISFEMVDLELGTIVWSGLYEMRKAARDNVVYR
ncbi:penicillin-binding protein activator LpoB [Marinobacter sp.]|uniref:penicillin-binding protein activator LpoB n=1 Tax=Marinobacter sp. TaxID=50741 RepID=UPI002B27A836|nr:penicillin-binding protein activator LpoB [Marinobacter sp.]